MMRNESKRKILVVFFRCEKVLIYLLTLVLEKTLIKSPGDGDV